MVKAKLRALSAWALLISGCRGPAPTAPAPSEHTTPLRAPGERPCLSVASVAAKPEPALAAAGAAPGVATAQLARTALADAGAPAGAVPSAPASLNVSGWSCFSWVHGRDFASPCFATARACTQARAKDAHQEKMQCSTYSGLIFCSPAIAYVAGGQGVQRCFQEPGRG